MFNTVLFVLIALVFFAYLIRMTWNEDDKNHTK